MKFGLIGYPLSHSHSKQYFTEKFQFLQLPDFTYENFALPDIEDVLPLLHNAFVGFNVTIPYKEKILGFINDIDKEAFHIGAVNCLVRTGLNSWKGYNTDASAFHRTIIEWFAGTSLPQAALVLGTGGASKAISFVLRKLGIEVSLVSSHFRGNFTYPELNRQIMEDHQLIINASPVGMFPHQDQEPDIPYAALTPHHYLYDLIYNPVNTVFLARGEQAGARTKNGLEMLRLQAEHAWAIWKSYGKF